MGRKIQEMLESELDEELGYVKHEKTEEPKSNYRNGHKPKKLKSAMGEIEISIPQDRNSEFEPKIVPKHKRDISEIEQKIINMYARGLTTREISKQIEDIYGFEASAQLVSRVTDKLHPLIEEWQNRRLSEVYPIVFIDALVSNVRKEKTVQKTAALYTHESPNTQCKHDNQHTAYIEHYTTHAACKGKHNLCAVAYIEYAIHCSGSAGHITD